MKNKKFFRKYAITISIIVLTGTIAALIYLNFHMPKPTLDKLNINSKNVTRIDIGSNHYDRKTIIITKHEEVDGFLNWINSVNIKYDKKSFTEGSDGESYIITFFEGDIAITSIGLKDGIITDNKNADYTIVNGKLDLRFLDKFFLY